MALKQPTHVGIGLKSRRTPLTYVQISRKSYCCVHVLLRVLRYNSAGNYTFVIQFDMAVEICNTSSHVKTYIFMNVVASYI